MNAFRKAYGKLLGSPAVARHWHQSAYPGEDYSKGNQDYFRGMLAEHHQGKWQHVKLNVADVEGHHVGHDATEGDIAHYAKQRQAGSPFPAIIAKPHPTKPGKFITVDGMHRLKAAQVAGDQQIDAHIPVMKSELRKMPLETPPQLVDSWMQHRGTKPVRPEAKRAKHVATNSLGQGLFHHVYEDRYSSRYDNQGPKNRVTTHHILSRNSDPKKPGVGAMKVADSDGEHPNVIHMVHTKMNLQGKGYGSKLYAAAAQYHGSLTSGRHVSQQAHRTWESLARNPSLGVKLAPRIAPGTERHLPIGYEVGRHTMTPTKAETLAASEKSLKRSELKKSPYGPTGMGLYSQNDNVRRKMGRTSESVAIGPNKAVQSTKPSASQQAASLAAEARRKSKSNPVKVYSQAEIAKLFRGGFKRPKMMKEEICMPKQDVIREHVKLIDTLKRPTKDKLREEAQEQSKELKEYRKR